MPAHARPIHLRPHAGVAERVLLPGDPGRALRLAQQLLDTPRMLNHNRGLWGYSGEAADGELLTIQSTGLGGPSTAIVVEELIALGARRLVRVGTGAALADRLQLGSLVVAEAVQVHDGVGRALGDGDTLAAEPGLLAALRAAAASAPAGAIVSSDLFYDPGPRRWPGALAVDLSAGALFAVAARHGAAAGCVLAISDRIVAGVRERIDLEELERAEVALGRVGAAALV